MVVHQRHRRRVPPFVCRSVIAVQLLFSRTYFYLARLSSPHAAASQPHPLKSSRGSDQKAPRNGRARRSKAPPQQTRHTLPRGLLPSLAHSLTHTRVLVLGQDAHTLPTSSPLKNYEARNRRVAARVRGPCCGPPKLPSRTVSHGGQPVLDVARDYVARYLTVVTVRSSSAVFVGWRARLMSFLSLVHRAALLCDWLASFATVTCCLNYIHAHPLSHSLTNSTRTERETEVKGDYVWGRWRECVRT